MGPAAQWSCRGWEAWGLGLGILPVRWEMEWSHQSKLAFEATTVYKLSSGLRVATDQKQPSASRHQPSHSWKLTHPSCLLETSARDKSQFLLREGWKKSLHSRIGETHEIQWKYKFNQYSTSEKNQWCHIDWNSVNVHWLSDTLTDSNQLL